MKRLLFLFVAIASSALAQWVDFSGSTGSTNLSGAMNAKPSARTGTGAPVGNCTASKDFYLDSATNPGTLYYCDATNHWTKVPLPPAAGIVKSTGSAFSTAIATDLTALFGGCSGTLSLGFDGNCHNPPAGYVVLTTGTGAPSANCVAPSTTNLAEYIDTTAGDVWFCNATNSWKKILSVSGSGPYLLTGTEGPAPGSPPASGSETCWFDQTFHTQGCMDSSGNAYQMILSTELASLQKHSCDMAFGSANAGSALVNGDLGPQISMCFIPQTATVLEVDVRADAGTPNIIVGVSHLGSVANLTSAALATGSAGARACSKTAAVTGIDGATTCSATLQNTGILAGDYIQAVSGTAGGTAKLMTVHVVYALN